PEPGQLAGGQLVSVTFSRVRVPGGEMRAGDTILLVATRGSSSGSDGEPPRTFPARVHEVRSATGRGSDLVVSLLVDQRDGATIASLAASGRVAIVLLPERAS